MRTASLARRPGRLHTWRGCPCVCTRWTCEQRLTFERSICQSAFFFPYSFARFLHVHACMCMSVPRVARGHFPVQLSVERQSRACVFICSEDAGPFVRADLPVHERETAHVLSPLCWLPVPTCCSLCLQESFIVFCLLCVLNRTDPELLPQLVERLEAAYFSTQGLSKRLFHPVSTQQSSLREVALTEHSTVPFLAEMHAVF